MDKRPAVSVIIPSYSKPQYLTECLRSIHQQTFPDWECLIVSDGSPRIEDIRAAVQGVADPRFRLVELPVNMGPAAARNAGVRFANAQNYIWVDEDDVLAPQCLERLWQVQQHRKAQIVRPQIGLLGSGKVLPKIHVPSAQEVLVRPGLYSVGFLVGKEVFDRAGMLDESPVLYWGLEDVEWWIRVIWAGVKIEIIEDVLYWYRPAETSPDRAVSQHHRGMLNAINICSYIVSKHREKYKLYPHQKQKFYARCYGMQVAAEIDSARFMAALLHSLARLRYEFNGRNIKLTLGLCRKVLCVIGEQLGAFKKG